MKFIVDAQLPKSLSEFINEQGHDSVHTLELPNKNNTTDQEIIEISNAENRVVISKDADFLETYMVKGQPAKLIMIKTGNITNSHLMKIFKSNLDLLLRMIQRSNLVEMSKVELVEHD